MRSLVYVVIVMSSALTGCFREFHTPIVQQATLFKEAGEARVQGHLGMTESAQTADMQAAMALTNRWAVQMSAQLARGWGGDDPSIEKGQGGQYTAGLGYYRPIGRFWVVENYAGLGFSHQRHWFPFNRVHDQNAGWHYFNQNLPVPGFSSFTFTGAFFYTQPAIGFRWKYVEAALSTNFQLGGLYSGRVENVVEANLDRQNYLNNHQLFLVEPAFTVRLGLKRLKLQGQMALSYEFGDNQLYLAPMRLSFGAVYQFNHPWRLRKRGE
jgi:hypothetical protein